MTSTLVPLPYYQQAVGMVAAAEHEIALAGIYTTAGNLPAAVEACRRAHAAYLRAAGLVGLWLRSLPAVPTEGGAVITAGLGSLREAESRLDRIGLRLDDLRDDLPADLLAA